MNKRRACVLFKLLPQPDPQDAKKRARAAIRRREALLKRKLRPDEVKRIERKARKSDPWQENKYYGGK